MGGGGAGGGDFTRADRWPRRGVRRDIHGRCKKQSEEREDRGESSSLPHPREKKTEINQRALFGPMGGPAQPVPAGLCGKPSGENVG